VPVSSWGTSVGACSGYVGSYVYVSYGYSYYYYWPWSVPSTCYATPRAFSVISVTPSINSVTGWPLVSPASTTSIAFINNLLTSALKNISAVVGSFWSTKFKKNCKESSELTNWVSGSI